MLRKSAEFLVAGQFDVTEYRLNRPCPRAGSFPCPSASGSKVCIRRPFPAGQRWLACRSRRQPRRLPWLEGKTPAMAAGLTDYVWTAADLLSLDMWTERAAAIAGVFPSNHG